MLYIVDLSQDSSNVNYYLSNTLISHVKKTLDNNKKVILYLNRRGFFSSLVCKGCSFLYKCKFCDVSLNVHSFPSKLLCHLCGYQEMVPKKCWKCNKEKLERVWVWTQQVEDWLRSIFSDKKIFRFDLDNLKNKSSKKDTREGWKNGKLPRSYEWTKNFSVVIFDMKVLSGYEEGE